MQMKIIVLHRPTKWQQHIHCIDNDHNVGCQKTVLNDDGHLLTDISICGGSLPESWWYDTDGVCPRANGSRPQLAYKAKTTVMRSTRVRGINGDNNNTEEIMVYVRIKKN